MIRSFRPVSWKFFNPHGISLICCPPWRHLARAPPWAHSWSSGGERIMKRHNLIPFLAALAIPCVLTAAGAVSLAQVPTDPGEFGDAPEGAPAYPNLGIAG